MWIPILSIALAIVLMSGDWAEAKRLRSRGRASASRANKHSRARAVRGSRARVERGRFARRGRRGRYLARSRRRHRRNAASPITGDLSRPSSATIPSERVIEIQNALIKAGYLDGPASGQYDENTIEAMKQFQSDNGLQETGYPSAHVLKKLGVSKRSNDGYAVPVGSVSDSGKKPPLQPEEH